MTDGLSTLYQDLLAGLDAGRSSTADYASKTALSPPMNGYWVINVADFRRTDPPKDHRRNGGAPMPVSCPTMRTRCVY